MKNNLGRKSMTEWLKTVQVTTVNLYNEAFQAGYDVAKDETPTVEDLTNRLMDQYTDGELEELAHRLDGIVAHGISKRPAKSANQQRAELIEKAKKFPEEKYDKVGVLTGRSGYHSPSESWALCNAEFIVNDEKRTVVCSLRAQIGDAITDKGIAKCHPDEVFNADIGKAIALARALGIPVPRVFIKAVQPDDKIEGMIINVPDSLYGSYTVVNDNVVAWSREAHAESINGKAGKIIDDTNAQYE